MIKKLTPKTSIFKHRHIYSFRKFAWLPKVVYDIETDSRYKVWMDFYYQNKTAEHNWQGRLELHHESKFNVLPILEWDTLKVHPFHSVDCITYKTQINQEIVKAMTPPSEETLMRKEISDYLNNPDE